MNSTGMIIFDTALAPCGIAWSQGRIAGLEIGAGTPKETAFLMAQRFSAISGSRPPIFIEEAIRKINKLLKGGNPDFRTLPLAMEKLPELNRKVYEIILQLHPGQTTTYGAIARTLGDVHLAQAVGYALGKNPFPIIVPCHRVLGTDGKLGGFSAAGGVAMKLRLLNIERATTGTEGGLFETLPLQARPQREV